VKNGVNLTATWEYDFASDLWVGHLLKAHLPVGRLNVAGLGYVATEEVVRVSRCIGLFAPVPVMLSEPQ
jgi:hypothetical protein